MVEVRQAGQTESTVRRQFAQDEGEGNRVRAARQGNEQTGSWRTEVVPPDRAPDVLEEGVSKRPNSATSTSHRAPETPSVARLGS